MEGLGRARGIVSAPLIKTMAGLTKEVVKNYLPKFSTLIERWVMFCCEPIITLLQCQVVLQFLIKECTLLPDICVKGFDKASSKTGAMLSKPEGMFETNEDS